MQIFEILWLAAAALILLGGLVALGVGHRRWNIGTVVAGFLVLLSAATFLYLAARLADRDRAWARKIADYQIKIAKAADDQVLDSSGKLVPQGGGAAGDGPESLARLRARRDHWRRGLDRIDTWHGRVWQGAAFQPPKDDASTGSLEFPAGLNEPDSPPLGVGAHVFLFDTAPFDQGGGYLGEFLVQATTYDPDAKRHTLTVAPTAPRDAYDSKVLAKAHDSVAVFEDLPVDRWLAFYRSRTASAGVMPQADKEDADKVRELLESSPEVGALVERFLDTFRQHEEEVPKDEWPDAEKEAAEHPGTLWAEVTFTKLHTFGPRNEPPAEGAGAAAPAAEAGPRRDYAAGDRAEFDLQTAMGLRDADQAVTVDRVFRRRPLTDALTLLHGGKGPGAAGDAADGTTTLLRLLQEELAALGRSNARLKAAIDAAQANADDESRVAKELLQDLTGKDPEGKQVTKNFWLHDVEEAGALVTAFEREIERTKRALLAAEAAIVANGRELTVLMTQLAREIDRVAPPPDRRAARP